MAEKTNLFDVVAGMWRGAEPMIEFQRDELGDRLEFSGQD
jgi:hypothetical protein